MTLTSLVNCARLRRKLQICLLCRRLGARKLFAQVTRVIRRLLLELAFQCRHLSLELTNLALLNR